MVPRNSKNSMKRGLNGCAPAPAFFRLENFSERETAAAKSSISQLTS